jgi:hypothetical protein
LELQNTWATERPTPPHSICPRGVTALALTLSVSEITQKA